MKLRVRELTEEGAAEAAAAASASAVAAAPSGDVGASPAALESVPPAQSPVPADGSAAATPAFACGVNAAAASVPAYRGSVLDEAAAAEQAATEWRTHVEPLLESTRLEHEAEALDLTEAERREKESLIAAGFSSWSRREYRAFVIALERHGRSARDAVIAEAAETAEKPREEVGAYYDTFMARGPTELAEWRKIEDRIIKGEQKVRRRLAMEALIAEKVARATDPFRTLTIAYGPNKGGSSGANKTFTEEEDRFLVCMLARVGYGAWDALRGEVLTAEQFRFDWFLKTRSATDLQRRCDVLVRLIEKEQGVDGELCNGCVDCAALLHLLVLCPIPALIVRS